MAAVVVPTVTGAVPTIQRYKIAGTVYVGASPAKKRVLAFRAGEATYLKGTTSNLSGVWAIAGLPDTMAASELVVIAVDDTATYNIEVFAGITPVAE